MTGENTRVSVQRQWLNRRTQQINACLEILCGFPKGSLTVIKGGNKQASRNSGQTHNGLAVQDISSLKASTKVKWSRILGHVLSHRTEDEGPWSAHCHGVNNGDNTAHKTALGQVAEIIANGDGLVGNRRDRGYRPKVWPVFVIDGDTTLTGGHGYRQCMVPCHAYENQSTSSKNLGAITMGTVLEAIAVTKVTTKVNGVYITREWFITRDGRCLYELNFKKIPSAKATPLPVVPPKLIDPVPELVEATMDARWASFNVNGGYTTKGGTWTKRKPGVVRTMLKSKSSLFLLQEAHEEKDEHKQILAEFKKQSHSRWVLAEGDGGNHYIMDGGKYKALGKAIVIRLPYDRDFILLNVWHIATGVRSWVWNTHLIASDPNKGRSRADAANMRTEQNQVIKRHLTRLKRCVGGGDGNDTDYSVGSIRQACETVNHIDVRKQVPEVINGELDSHDGYKVNEAKGKWIDFLGAGPYVKVLEAGLIDSGDDSDHNLIYTRFQITGPVTEYEKAA